MWNYMAILSIITQFYTFPPSWLYYMVETNCLNINHYFYNPIIGRITSLIHVSLDHVNLPFVMFILFVTTYDSCCINLMLDLIMLLYCMLTLDLIKLLCISTLTLGLISEKHYNCHMIKVLRIVQAK